jgi:hypothetical protein
VMLPGKLLFGNSSSIDFNLCFFVLLRPIIQSPVCPAILLYCICIVNNFIFVLVKFFLSCNSKVSRCIFASCCDFDLNDSLTVTATIQRLKKPWI